MNNFFPCIGPFNNLSDFFKVIVKSMFDFKDAFLLQNLYDVSIVNHQ